MSKSDRAVGDRTIEGRARKASVMHARVKCDEAKAAVARGHWATARASLRGALALIEELDPPKAENGSAAAASGVGG